MTSNQFTVPSFDELERIQADLSAILTLLPHEIRHGIDTSGKAEKYSQPTKKVKFGGESKSAPVLPANEEVKSRVLAKISELRSKRGGVKKSEKPVAEKTTVQRNKPSKVDGVKQSKDTSNAEKPKSKTQEPIKEAKMMLSNLDTKSEDPLVVEKESKMKKKKVTDPKQLLQQAIKRKEKLDSKKTVAEDPEKVEKDQAMKAALAKARGEKLTDDIKLLKSAVKSREKRKEKSKKEWSKRIRTVEKQKVTKQKKRADNIAKRKSKK